MLEPRRKEELDQWFTDPELAKEFVEWCGLKSTDRVLEPTIGSGELVAEIIKTGASVDCFEMDMEWVAYCRDRFPGLHINDACNFLSLERPSVLYDVCVQNPPLSDGDDGVFLVETCLHWARRTCSIVQTKVFHSDRRREELWNKVTVSRIKFLSSRPSFGRGSPMGDFSFIEIMPRIVQRNEKSVDLAGISFL